MLSGPAATAINHLLRDAGWARERLASFVGCGVRFEVPPVRVAFLIDAGGYLVPEEGPQSDPATIVRLTAPTLVRLMLLHDDSARREIEVDGDAALASALTSVLAGLRWNIEEDLSHIFGDVAAHRLALAGSDLLAWPANAASNFAHALAEYWTAEQPLLVGHETLREFVRAVDALRDDAQRLEKRIERLGRVTARHAGA
jgi:ubiquinone biosynthesis accessory factor UbiJ